MEYSERVKEKYNTAIENIDKIEDENTRMHLKLKLMADMINEISNVKTQ